MWFLLMLNKILSESDSESEVKISSHNGINSSSWQYIHYYIPDTTWWTHKRQSKRTFSHIDMMPHMVCLHSGDDITIDWWWCHDWLCNCDACTWKVISNSLDINFIHGDIHVRNIYSISLYTPTASKCQFIMQYMCVNLCKCSDHYQWQVGLTLKIFSIYPHKRYFTNSITFYLDCIINGMLQGKHLEAPLIPGWSSDSYNNTAYRALIMKMKTAMKSLAAKLNRKHRDKSVLLPIASIPCIYISLKITLIFCWPTVLDMPHHSCVILDLIW